MESNKIFAAILLTLVTLWSAYIAADIFVSPKKLSENAYVVAVTDAPSAATETTTAAEAIPAIAPFLAAASVEAGQAIFKKCTACHTVDKGGANRVGPNLWGIVNAPIMHLENFSYSKAFQALKGQKTWTYESLNQYLANPKKYIPGTKMNFAGLSKPEDRASLILFLRSQSAQPAPLP